MAYKSKCSEVDLCCVKIIRNTEGELKEDALELRKGQESKKEVVI